MLRTRVVSAAVLIPLVGAAVYLGGPVLAAFVALVALLAGYEYLRVVLPRTSSTGWVAILLSALALALLVGFVADAQWPQLRFRSWGLATTVLLPLLVQVFRGNEAGSLDAWALVVAGVLYVGFSLSHTIYLRALDRGLQWTAIALVGTWTNDTGAYLVGSHVGHRPFFPRISPKKTLEGAVGGVVLGTVGVAALAALVGLPLGWGRGALLGLAISVAATFGDLAESVVKRQLGVKDTGRLIPGHGGALDRVDSLLFVLPTVYYLALAFT